MRFHVLDVGMGSLVDTDTDLLVGLINLLENIQQMMTVTGLTRIKTLTAGLMCRSI